MGVKDKGKVMHCQHVSGIINIKDKAKVAQL